MSSQDKILLIGLSCVFGPIFLGLALLISYVKGGEAQRDKWVKECISRGYMEQYIEKDCIKVRWIQDTLPPCKPYINQENTG